MRIALRPTRLRLLAQPKIADLHGLLSERLARLLADDPALLGAALEVGLVDRQWLEDPGQRPLSSVPRLEVVRRFMERAAERRPSTLAAVGLNAVQMLSWDVSWARGVDGDDATSAEMTVVFTDLEGFTPFTAEYGDEAALMLLAEHHRASTPIVRRWGGRVVKRLGDGLMLVFADPESAVAAAIEMVPTVPAPLRLRAGIHVGQAMVTADDLIGHVVNIAARVTDQAAGGQVLITDQVRQAVGDIDDVTFTPLPIPVLKGVDEHVSIYIAERM